MRELEGIAQVKVLQTHHGGGCAFLIQPVIVNVELFEQLHQSLLPPIDVSHMLLGVDVSCIGGCLDLKHKVSADHHLSHFEGPGVPIQSKILLCFNSLIVAPPHSVAIVSNL